MMRRILIAALMLCSPVLMGASGQPVIDGFMEPAGFVRITSLSSSVSLGTIPNGTKLTLIQPETQDIRWRDDGVAPTSAVGMLLSAGQTLVYNGNPSALRIIQTQATSTVNVTFYR